ncbi:uncharacterized protein LOC132639284 [Lycium barbarum]|uniref:uncharacterized protein LOC132639284 n=1 Tax=Lycium barbarum TaxID=112863 RepID=UPI00293F1E07|nr:uncharacterized protein LOC132639284 [Lycium barbarum]
MGMELAAENVELTDAKLFSRVRAALKSAHQGDLDHYKELLEFVQCDERHSDKVARKVTTLEALSGSVFSLDIIHHRSLVSSILGMSMWNYGTDVMDALMEFVISLVCASSHYKNYRN